MKNHIRKISILGVGIKKMNKTKGMSPVEYRNELTRRRTGIVQKNIESAKAV